MYRYKKPPKLIEQVDRIKRLSNEILSEHKEKFGTDFGENKKILDSISIIRSKGLKNELAGFITKFIKKEILDKELTEQRNQESKASAQEETPAESTTETPSESPTESTSETQAKESEESPAQPTQ